MGEISRRSQDSIPGPRKWFSGRSFEAMYHFGKLLAKYPNNILQHLSDKEFRLLNDFDIRANKLSNGSTDYLENKKIYFIRKQDGQIKTVKE